MAAGWELIEAVVGTAIALILLTLFTGMPTVAGVALGVLAGMVLATALRTWRSRRRASPRPQDS